MAPPERGPGASGLGSTETHEWAAELRPSCKHLSPKAAGRQAVDRARALQAAEMSTPHCPALHGLVCTAGKVAPSGEEAAATTHTPGTQHLFRRLQPPCPWTAPHGPRSALPPLCCAPSGHVSGVPDTQGSLPPTAGSPNAEGARPRDHEGSGGRFQSLRGRCWREPRLPFSCRLVAGPTPTGSARIPGPPRTSQPVPCAGRADSNLLGATAAQGVPAARPPSQLSGGVPGLLPPSPAGTLFWRQTGVVGCSSRACPLPQARFYVVSLERGPRAAQLKPPPACRPSQAPPLPLQTDTDSLAQASGRQSVTSGHGGRQAPRPGRPHPARSTACPPPTPGSPAAGSFHFPPSNVLAAAQSHLQPGGWALGPRGPRAPRTPRNSASESSTFGALPPPSPSRPRTHLTPHLNSPENGLDGSHPLPAFLGNSCQTQHRFPSSRRRAHPCHTLAQCAGPGRGRAGGPGVAAADHQPLLRQAAQATAFQVASPLVPLSASDPPLRSERKPPLGRSPPRPPGHTRGAPEGPRSTAWGAAAGGQGPWGRLGSAAPPRLQPYARAWGQPSGHAPGQPCGQSAPGCPPSGRFWAL